MKSRPDDYDPDAAAHDLLVDAERSAPDDNSLSDVDAGAYLRAYYRLVPAEELLHRTAEDLAAAAFAHHGFAVEPVADAPRIRIYSPTRERDGWESDRTVVDVVTTDMPFVVDTLVAELARHEVGMHMLAHPQLMVERGASGRLVQIHADPNEVPSDEAVSEAWVHVEIDRLSTSEEAHELANDLFRVLGDARVAVQDWRRMRAAALAVATSLSDDPPPVDEDEVADAVALLQWLADDHFTFLGYREYERVEIGGEDVVRVVEGSGLGILRGEDDRARAFAAMPDGIAAKTLEPSLLVLTKANSRSTVHRTVYLDYVGVKTLDAQGRVIGERRFVGLLSSAAYLESVRRLPVVRRKVDEVLARAGVDSRSYSGKDLIAILETYPRDELFQIDVDDLYPIVLGVLALADRRRLRLFLRRDDFGRFYSCLVYLPRDRYTTDARLKMQEILRSRLSGTTVEYTARVTESVLARLHFVVRTPPEISDAAPPPNVTVIQAELADATRSWEEDLADEIVSELGAEHGPPIQRRYGTAYSEAYKEDFGVGTAVEDLLRLQNVQDTAEIGLNLYRQRNDPPTARRFKIYRVGGPLSLSDVLPIFASMGLKVTDERPYELTVDGVSSAWIYDVGLEAVPQHASADGVQNAFAAAWRGESEVDGFAALVPVAGLAWRQVVVLRSYARYLRQAGWRYSQDYIERAATANPAIVRDLVALFEARFDPAYPRDRDAAQSMITDRIHAALDEVQSLDSDRILRGLLNIIAATDRTNYFQRGVYAAAGSARPSEYLVTKLDPQRIDDLPAPRPMHEIWVYSPRVEGVHLRFGPVARGGLRWSDRLQDFRTEILGLVKAQTVKNVVIVPVGSKGGFVIKRPPADRDALGAESRACYAMFIAGMLEVTDNIVEDSVVAPPQVVRHDDDDTYLVVAADKGTATYSDLANDVAREHGFWLGDAFASGGSAGFDHKAMGITARGAWESVRHHFRELGVDPDRDPITAVGVGDMSGDVFGNGMLLSESIRLVAAFDHRHVFVDPDPDAAVGHAERARLFALTRSSWAEYNKSLISAGGGVFSRTAKSVRLTPQIRSALGIADDVAELPPNELVRAVLQAPVDLFWNGGIGTYVKASSQSHAAAGDKSNDSVRIDGTQLRVKVVGEGGNLGFTQPGRVEFAAAGGHINTDAIDNSAGVDTSDHEVNIKILLDTVVRAGALEHVERDSLLAGMTDEVALLVLRHNASQNLALRIGRAQAPAMIGVHTRLIKDLERSGLLDRALEYLPDTAELSRRASAGGGLTSPEIAVLLAYTKIAVSGAVNDSELPDGDWFVDSLLDYFPKVLAERFPDGIEAHRLRRQIVTTRLVNEMVDLAGTTYVFRAIEETGAAVADVARVFCVVRDVFGLADLAAALRECEGTVPIEVLVRANLIGRRLLDRATRWFLQSRRHPIDVAAQIASFAPTVRALQGDLRDLVTGHERVQVEAEVADLVADGIPEPLAAQIATLLEQFSLLDVTEIVAARIADGELDESARTDVSVTRHTASVYFALSSQLGLGDLLSSISSLSRSDRWSSLARSSLRYDLFAALAELTASVLSATDEESSTEDRIATWEEANASSLGQVRRSLAEMPDEQNLATLSVILRQLRSATRASATPMP